MKEAIPRIALEPVTWIVASGGWWGTLDTQWKALGVIVVALTIGFVSGAGSERWGARFFEAPNTVEATLARVALLEVTVSVLRAEFDAYTQNLGTQVEDVGVTVDELERMVYRSYCIQFTGECDTVLTPRGP